MLHARTHARTQTQEVLRELVVVIMGSWGMAEEAIRKFSEDFFVERFDYNNVVRKLALTSMGKLYLPFWSSIVARFDNFLCFLSVCSSLTLLRCRSSTCSPSLALLPSLLNFSLCVVTYVYLQRLITVLSESYFFHDTLRFSNHINPGTDIPLVPLLRQGLVKMLKKASIDYYGRLAVACLETCTYESSSWEQKVSLFTFIMAKEVCALQPLSTTNPMLFSHAG